MIFFLRLTYKKVAIESQYIGDYFIKNVVIFEKSVDNLQRICYIQAVPDKGALIQTNKKQT